MVKIIQTVYPNGYSNDKKPVLSEMLFEDVQAAWESLLEIFLAYNKVYASDYYDMKGLFNCASISYDDDDVMDDPYINMFNPPKECPKLIFPIVAYIDNACYCAEWKLISE